MATIVKFFYSEANEDLFAYFPYINFSFTNKGENLKMCYAHVGQHSGCDKNYVKRARKATPKEYTPLLEELKSVGYNDLIVKN